MGLLVSSEHCIASPKLAPVASLVSAPALALSFIHTISTTYRFGPCGVVGDALASSQTLPMLARSYGLERLPKKAAARLGVDHPNRFSPAPSPLAYLSFGRLQSS